MATATQSIIIFLHSFVAWLGLLVFFQIFKDIPRLWFTVWHYVAVSVIFGCIFFVYFTFFNQYSTFLATAFALMSILTIEFFVYSFLYKGDLWFINPLDWLGSVVLAGVVIFLIGSVLGK